MARPIEEMREELRKEVKLLKEEWKKNKKFKRKGYCSREIGIRAKRGMTRRSKKKERGDVTRREGSGRYSSRCRGVQCGS